MTTTSRLSLRVFGRVQGVGFRFFIEREAKGLGLSGWVRNMPDGSVEVEAEGERARLEALVGRAREGPPLSRVTRVDETWDEGAPRHADFRVRTV
jgi:acylphosphatase